MKRQDQRLKTLAGMAVLALASGLALAQSSDALLDKLVEKGILSVKEANELREEVDKDFTKAYQVKSGLPDWVTSLKISGDVRGRYENISIPNRQATLGSTSVEDRNRFRYRLRVGATATLKDNFEVGFRLTSSEASGSFGGDPISGNTTMSGNGSKKFVYIDLVYGRWTPINNAGWVTTLTVGKMENPFVFSDIVFDGDYTPEGAALNLTRHLGEKHALKLNAGGFALWESSGSPRDAYLVGGQLRLDSTWSPKWQSSVGIGLLDLIHSYSLLTNNVPRVNRGNARTAAGQLVNEYSPLVLDGSLTYLLESFPGYTGAFPLKVAGEYLVNHRVSKQNDAWSVGLTLGKSGKKGLWDIAYRYKCIEPEAWWDELADSDFGAYYAKSPYGNGYFAGTNVRGHVLKATYSPFDSMTLAVTCFLTDLVHAYPNPAARSAKSDATRLQVDMSWKF